MKRILPLLAAMIALTTVLPGKAQTGKYYIDGRETTREELLKLPAGTIESMANSVENGLPVVRIKLKPEGEEQAPATGQQEKNTATPHEKAMQLVRGIYEQHTCSRRATWRPISGLRNMPEGISRLQPCAAKSCC